MCCVGDHEKNQWVKFYQKIRRFFKLSVRSQGGRADKCGGLESHCPVRDAQVQILTLALCLVCVKGSVICICVNQVKSRAFLLYTNTNALYSNKAIFSTWRHKKWG